MPNLFRERSADKPGACRRERNGKPDGTKGAPDLASWQDSLKDRAVSEDCLVRAVSLEKRFGKTHAVRGVTLDVRAGEIVGLLGPNGAGKTTTLRMLSAVLTPTAGTASIAGHSVDTNPQAVRRAIGFLTGGTALYVRLTPREILRYFGRLYERPIDEIEARSATLIRDLAMTSFADRPCGTLSTGQRQRANIARALIHDPPVLVFDEPTLGLDIAGARFILDFLRNARASGKAILFSSHTIGDIEALCDRIAVLCSGRIAMLAPRTEILAHTGHATLAESFLSMVDASEPGDDATAAPAPSELDACASLPSSRFSPKRCAKHFATAARCL